MGYVGGSIFSVLNILTQLGFSTTAVILGGQTLTNVSDGKLPLEASIVLVGLVALLLCFFGYEGESVLRPSGYEGSSSQLFTSGNDTPGFSS